MKINSQDEISIEFLILIIFISMLCGICLFLFDYYIAIIRLRRKLRKHVNFKIQTKYKDL